jgi:hypothetical protein
MWTVMGRPSLPAEAPDLRGGRRRTGGPGGHVPRPCQDLSRGRILTFTATGSLDKNWIVCDNTSTSAFFGNCYTQYDVTSNNGIRMRTSTNGGVTWGAALSPSGGATGLCGQPIVRPNGTVLVPYQATNAAQIRSFRATGCSAGYLCTPVDRSRNSRQSYSPCSATTIPAPSTSLVAVTVLPPSPEAPDRCAAGMTFSPRLIVNVTGGLRFSLSPATCLQTRETRATGDGGTCYGDSGGPD